MTMKASDRAAKLLAAEEGERQRTLLKMSDKQRRSLETHWDVWAHKGQLPPPGPPATPMEGQAWLVGPSPTGAWEGQAGALAAFEAGTWLFITPRDGMQVFDQSAGQYARFSGTWQRATAPVAPTGGTVVDSEARAAIVQLIEALASAGILPDA